MATNLVVRNIAPALAQALKEAAAAHGRFTNIAKSITARGHQGANPVQQQGTGLELHRPASPTGRRRAPCTRRIVIPRCCTGESDYVRPSTTGCSEFPCVRLTNRGVALQSRARPLILMDMQMPKTSGVDASLSIRKLPGRADVSILAMSANPFTEDREKCLAAGMNDFITKPVDPELMFKAVYRWLSSNGVPSNPE